MLSAPQQGEEREPSKGRKRKEPYETFVVVIVVIVGVGFIAMWIVSEYATSIFCWVDDTQ